MPRQTNQNDNRNGGGSAFDLLIYVAIAHLIIAVTMYVFKLILK